MSETMITDRWLYDTLSNDTTVAAEATGGIHSDVAPQGTESPYVVFSYSDGEDVRVVDGSRVFTDATYLVKAVLVGASYAALEALVDAIDAVLHNSSAVSDDGAIVWCVRERPIRYAESVNGEEYRHLGALYRIQARKE